MGSNPHPGIHPLMDAWEKAAVIGLCSAMFSLTAFILFLIVGAITGLVDLNS